MKTTIDIPDELYRKVKAKSAVQGRRVRDVTVELFQHWIEGKPDKRAEPGWAQAWLDDWLKLGEKSPAGILATRPFTPVSDTARPASTTLMPCRRRHDVSVAAFDTKIVSTTEHRLPAVSD